MSSGNKCILYLADNCMFSGLIDNYLDVISMHRNNNVIDISVVTSNFYRGNSDYFNSILNARGLKFIPFKDVDSSKFDYVISYYGISAYSSFLAEEKIIRKTMADSINELSVESIREKSYKNFSLCINALQELLSHGFNEKKIIPCTVLCNPDFSIDMLEKLRCNPPSIITNNCYGRYTYMVLGTPFYSPFVNITLSPKEYLKLLKNLERFIHGRLVFAGMRDLNKRDSDLMLQNECSENINVKDPVMVPTAYLESDNDKVLIYCNHYKTFDDFEKVWNKRKERINYDNLVAVMTTQSSDDASEFSELPFKKMCFLHDINNNDLLDVREIDKGIVKFNYDIFKAFYETIFTKKYGITLPQNDYFAVSNSFGMRDLPFFNLLEFLVNGIIVITKDINMDMSVALYLTKIIWG